MAQILVVVITLTSAVLALRFYLRARCFELLGNVYEEFGIIPAYFTLVTILVSPFWRLWHVKTSLEVMCQGVTPDIRMLVNQLTAQREQNWLVNLTNKYQKEGYSPEQSLRRSRAEFAAHIATFRELMERD